MNQSASSLAHAVRTGTLDPLELIRASLKKAEAVQQDCNAFISICHDEALQRAEFIEEKRAKGETLGALAGVPVVVKDNICTRGIRTTAASKSLAGFVPPYSATVIERLEQADAIILAKSNLDEFGMGSATSYSAYGQAKNPLDTSRVPGGSSGGSAIAVATGVAPLALGTDTGGSVRQPASFCGIVGYKPTYGVLSRYGVIAFASSLDQVGVLASDAEDVQLAMQVMAGRDAKDSTSLEQSLFSEASPTLENLAGVRIGVIRELSGEGNSAGVLAALQKSKATLEHLGASLHDISLPHAPYGIAAYYLVAPAEASSNLARYDGTIFSQRVGDNAMGQVASMQRSRAQSFGKEVQRRILIGSYALSAGYYDAYYNKALKVRRLIANDLQRAFSEVDVVIAPTSSSVAYAIGAKSSDPLAAYLDDMNTVLANLAGIPALSVPMGNAEDGLPCGLQMLAPALGDAQLLSIANCFQQATQ